MDEDGPAARRRPAVTAAMPSAKLEGLDLDQLRTYRADLTAEEDRVSYWRRVVFARMDLLEAQSQGGGVIAFADLVRALGDTGSGGGRRRLVRVPAVAELPDLPELAHLEELWATQVDTEVVGQGSAITGLQEAGAMLSDYRTALHERIGEATRELILRYREDPMAALSILPPA